MIAHGLSAAGMFIICGQLYERLHTRDMRQMGGLWGRIKYLPALSLFFAVATLGMPGTGNFVGEFMILFGSFQVVPVITVIATFGLVFCVGLLAYYDAACLLRYAKIGGSLTGYDRARTVHRLAAGGVACVAGGLPAADPRHVPCGNE